MEPILELATRITSQLWYLHGLFPDRDRLNHIAREWRARAEPNSYWRSQALLDLAGERYAWTASEWYWPYHAPPAAPEAHELEGYSPVAVYHWLRGRFEAEVSDWPFREIRRCWNDLKAAEGRALEIVGQRLNALHVAGVLRDVHLQRPSPAASPFSKTAEPPAEARSLTREELFEGVIDWLLAAPLAARVALAAEFLPNDEFFVEEPLNLCAEAVTKRFRPATEEYQIARDWLDARAHREQKLARLLDPDRYRQLSVKLGVATPFSMVLRDELDEVARTRLTRLRGIVPSDDEAATRESAGVAQPVTTAARQAHRSQLFGLALSGGGIRSATFALGLLQGMADRHILPYIDLLSTVSGGGYIGSWLISWIKRNGSVASVQRSLRGNATDLGDCLARQDKREDDPQPEPYGLVGRNADPHADHVRPIGLLRQYSRYLAPQAGLFAADTWAIVSTWLRNTLLNLFILVSLLGAVVLAPRFATFVLIHVHSLVPGTTTVLDFLKAVLVAGVPLLAASAVIGSGSLSQFGPYSRQSGPLTRGDNDLKLVTRVLPLLVIGAFAEASVLWYSGDKAFWPRALAFVAVVILSLSILVSYSKARDLSRGPWKGSLTWRVLIRDEPVRYIVALVATVVAVITALVLMKLLFGLAQRLQVDTERGVWIVASGGTALVLLMFVAIVVVFIGLLGNQLTDEQREWWSRMGAWLGLAMTAWLVICMISFFVPLWIGMLSLKGGVLGIGWGTITAWGAKLAYSPKSGRDDGAGQSWLNSAILALAPSVFVLGMLSLVSIGLFWLVAWTVKTFPALAYGQVAHWLCCSGVPFTWQHLVDYYWPLLYGESLAPLALIVLLLGFSLLFAWRVDINQFSMHNFYKNRLVRCYLGASRARAHRQPNAFTGFDLEDDIRLSRFRHGDPSQTRDMAMDCAPSYSGPFPIVNTTLNITGGADLGLQERKGESFTFTPLWSGFDYARRQASVKRTALREYGFRRTDTFGEPARLGVSVGTAMAISGAAFNSNAGFHTSPSLAFLLTVFGVRLGWWAGNPRRRYWSHPSPPLALTPLARELTASTSTSSGFVLLSDGGHFENMGLYELVRRRCRYIILSDAEEDLKFKLEGIGGAIRKCRVDFGVVINLNLQALQPLGDPGVSRFHYSLGTILYPGESECGKLVYVKSSVTGDEPVDVIEFRKRHTEFPHTSTANQFFDESHFESYRALGHHVAAGIFNHDMPATPAASPQEIHERIKELFARIEADWEANLSAVNKEKSDAKK